MPDYSFNHFEELLLNEHFIRYCQGNDAGATRFWNDWQAGDEHRIEQVKAAKALYHMLSVTASNETVAAGEARLRASLQQGTAVKREAPPVKDIRLRWIRWAAAAVLVGSLLTIAFWFGDNTNQPAFRDQIAEIHYGQEYRAPEVGRSRLTLPDGSVVTLNSGSVLKLDARFNQQHRRLLLEGEAFFEVAHNPDRPFTVITKRNLTTALGTSFKVRSYQAEDGGTVELSTGKVSVEAAPDLAKEETILLNPGESANWSGAQLMEKSRFNRQALENWRQQRLVFEQASLEQVIEKLQLNYGVQLKLENQPRSRIAFTGKFDGKELDDVLEAIAFTNKFSYHQKGSMILIRFK